MAEKKLNKAKAQPEKEIKKTAVVRAGKKVKEQKKQPNAISRFFRETIGELRKVNWPTWAETRKLTGVVLIVLVVTGIFLGLVDFGAAYLLDLMAGLR